MKLTSTQFRRNGYIPTTYTCDGANVNPPLAISDIPKNTVSLVLEMDDPDAPGGTWVHWTVWNISPETKTIMEGELPKGSVEGLNSGDNFHYDGPCPPQGAHHYHFKLYALDTMLDLSQVSTEEELNSAMKGHIIDSSVLVGFYERGISRPHEGTEQ